MGAEELAEAQVLGAVVQDGGGGFAVAPGAADLLVVAVQRVGDVGVNDEADVGFVDAHAEGGGGHHHVQFVVEELLVDAVPLALLPAGVVGLSARAQGSEFGRVGLGVLAGGGVQQAGAFELGHLLGDGAALVLVCVVADHFEPDVGPVEAVHQDQRVHHVQALLDLLAHRRRSSGGKADDGRVAQLRADLAEA
ncbi:hypothetical protein D9M72_505060 [compost metagenome]